MRKFTTFLLSFVFFPKPFTFMHGISALVVMGGFSISVYSGKIAGKNTAK
tara:strand:+ start:160 stop:309 length:150 start_codon:yes stop_codon:yes gene_type:complete